MPFYKAWNIRREKESLFHLLQTVADFVCKGENFIQLIFGHDLFHLQLMNMNTFISVYFVHCFFLFCLWISTEAKRKLVIDEKQTVKVEDDGTESKLRVRGRGICQDLLPHTPED